MQPTWEETQSVPRSSSGMNTVSNSIPGAVRSSHLRVPSSEICSVTTSGRAEAHGLGHAGAEILGEIGHGGEIALTVDIDPVPELARAHAGGLGLEPGGFERG